MGQAATLDVIDARIRNDLRAKIDPKHYDLWFDRTARFGLREERLHIAVPSQFHATWISSRFREDLKAAGTMAAGRPVEVCVEVEPSAFSEPATPARATEAGRGVRRRRERPAAEARFDLDLMIRTPHNASALETASGLASGESAFNPVYFQGPCGVGKTHLLVGICRRASRLQPGIEVRYLTGEEFTNQYIDAVRSHRLSEFRQQMRRIDLLAVDDVHFLSAKPGTQKEFLHTFDAIVNRGGRVVMASDLHPRDIDGVEPRLLSRLTSGLLSSISMPQREDRRVLLAGLSERMGLTLSTAAVETLAGRSRGSVRDLMALLTRLSALAMVERGGVADGGEIGMVLVERLFAQDGPKRPRRRLHLSEIIEAVCRRTGADAEQLAGRTRKPEAVVSRHLIAALAKRFTDMSFPEIAAGVGKGSHSSFVTGVKRLRSRMEAGERVYAAGSSREVSLQGLHDELVEELEAASR